MTSPVKPDPIGDGEVAKAVERLNVELGRKHDCSVCDGDGKVQRRDPPYGIRDCGGCDATGERYDLHPTFRRDLSTLLTAYASLVEEREKVFREGYDAGTCDGQALDAINNPDAAWADFQAREMKP